MVRPALLIAALALSPALVTPVAAPSSTLPLSDYVARFAPAHACAEGMVSFAVREGRLTMAPLLWRPARILVPTGRDSFQMEDRTERTVVFHRDASGRVDSVAVRGMGFDEPLAREADTAWSPAELAVRGDSTGAAAAFLAQGADLEILCEFAERMANVPTLVPRAAAFAAALVAARPMASCAWAELGATRVAAGRRGAAVVAYRRALALDPADEEGVTPALERLGALRVPAAERRAGWSVPFSLRALFAPPTPAEIARARRDWAARDLSPRDVRVEFTRQVAMADGIPYDLHVYSHRVHGARHYGAVLVPRDAFPDPRPAIVEARGVSWNFSPLHVPEGLSAPGVPGHASFIYVVPSFRGETMIVGADTLRSEGDASDSWDGATDDLLAFLDVAIAATPAIDTTRIGVFGRSRGGSVALLAAARDRRLRAVCAWAAPADWFGSMGQEGWTQEEEVADGLLHRASTHDLGGQFIDTFLKPAIARQGAAAGLKAVRLHMIASSPRYFMDTVPAAEAHYGLEDGIVPPVNGAVLEAAARAAGRSLTLRLHADAGHDQDLFDTPRQTLQYFLGALRGPRPPAAND
jgi:hypothetical protein